MCSRWAAVLVGLILLVANGPYAYGAQSDAIRLKIRPVLCITDNKNPACDMRLVIVWEATEPGTFCLYNSDSDMPLICWRDVATGHHVDRRVVSETLRYWLTDEGKTRLVEAAVVVMTAATEDRRRRRKRRHVWSVL